MKDKNKIEMEDISAFPLERSANHRQWEEITYSELKGEVLEGLMEEKLKCFLRVVRSGSPFKLADYYYRIKC
ncbi:MAG: hypothetical protein VX579_02600 [Nitrospinota bacterium]|nr:hypothetical protein [Nitrospinota bacterium]MEC9019319.1 hypothetical protein [Nitrospinota bacterium]MEC9423052.1 hypothetical protein [Nitrospinota bacterium]MEE3253967.1 hypothetical protein [Nitrospinota bacterium]